MICSCSLLLNFLFVIYICCYWFVIRCLILFLWCLRCSWGFLLCLFCILCYCACYVFLVFVSWNWCPLFLVLLFDLVFYFGNCSCVLCSLVRCLWFVLSFSILFLLFVCCHVFVVRHRFLRSLLLVLVLVLVLSFSVVHINVVIILCQLCSFFVFHFHCVFCFYIGLRFWLAFDFYYCSRPFVLCVCLLFLFLFFVLYFDFNYFFLSFVHDFLFLSFVVGLDLLFDAYQCCCQYILCYWCCFSLLYFVVD